jgi:FixJ family two-component response regulator
VNAEPTVFIVDDDPALRDSLSWLLGSMKVAVRAFGSAEEFLAAYDPALPGCLVLDVCMPGMSGLQLQAVLTARGARLSVIVVSGHADAAMAWRAMQAGACDFLEKPFDDGVLIERVRHCLAARADGEDDTAPR